jgi:hypothetical protein
MGVRENCWIPTHGTARPALRGELVGEMVERYVICRDDVVGRRQTVSSLPAPRTAGAA